MDAILTCENVRFTYPDTTREILHSVSLSVERGSFTVLLGHNGSGKSTLAKLFNGILLPTSGRVTVNGMDTQEESTLLRVRQTVGMVFQNPDNQIVSSVVEEDVAFAPENLGIPSSEIRTRVDAALSAVGMTEYLRHAPHLLSGGQKQRIAIAGVLAMLPECIVLDEPTAMLDPEGRREVMDTLFRLNRERGITVLLITHHMDEAIRADRALVMDNGALVMDDTPRALFLREEELVSHGLSVPASVRLARRLNGAGYHIPASCMTPREVTEAILSELRGEVKSHG